MAVDAYMQSSANRDFFDVIFMDINMPVMDGLEATEKIRGIEAANKYQKIIIIAVTAYSSEIERGLCQKVGMDAHLAKPISLDSLISTLQNVLQYQQSLLNLSSSQLADDSQTQG